MDRDGYVDVWRNEGVGRSPMWVQRIPCPNTTLGFRFGYSIALTAAPFRMAIGAPSTSLASNSLLRAVYVYRFQSASMKFDPDPEHVIRTPTANFKFGESLAWSDDGSLLVIGSSQSAGGFLYIVDFRTTPPLERSYSPTGFQEFGHWVAVNAAGSYIIAGAFRTGLNSTGAVVGISRDIVTGDLNEEFRSYGESDNRYLGNSVASNCAGNILLGGGSGEFNNDNKDPIGGRVFRYSQMGENETIFSPEDGSFEDNFGQAVSLSCEGSLAVIGAPGKSAVYLYPRMGSNITIYSGPFKPFGVNGGKFGQRAVLSGSGRTLLVAAPLLNSGAGRAFFMFDQDPVVIPPGANLSASVDASIDIGPGNLVTVTSPVTIGGNLTVGGQLVISNSLTVLGSSTISGTVVTNGTASFSSNSLTINPGASLQVGLVNPIAASPITIVIAQYSQISGTFTSIVPSVTQNGDTCTSAADSSNYMTSTLTVTISFDCSKAGLTTGQLIGVIVGTILGSIVLVVLIVLLMLHVRRRNTDRMNMELKQNHLAQMS